ncbi:MAG: hypothetical protein PHF76_11440 [Bacteroidales bacterium]|nr:hypothetical protein [Bacteroidales bacterium]
MNGDIVVNLILAVSLPWGAYIVWAYGKPWTIKKGDDRYPLLWGIKQLFIFNVGMGMFTALLKHIFKV